VPITVTRSLLARLHSSIDVLYREMVKFGAVGAVAFVVDIGVFNLMRTGIIGGDHGFPEKPLTAKTISVFIATIVAWIGNRYWTFRRRRRASPRREFLLFGIMNLGGLAIALACLAFSHYVLQLTSALADNIAGNVIGLGFGTLFRFWAYRQLVFTSPDEQALLRSGPGSAPASEPAPVIDLRSHGRPIPATAVPVPATAAPTTNPASGSPERREA
jgi:putative flippase GtrA